MKDTIRALLSVQEVDIELFSINKDLDFFPKEIERLENEAKILAAEQEKLDKELSKLDKKTNALQNDLTEGEKLLLKLQKQLNATKSQSEYVFTKNQLEMRRRENADIERECLKLMEGQEEMQAARDQHRVQTDAKLKELNDYKAETAQRIQEMKSRIDVLEAQKNAVLADIPDIEKDTYNRVAKARGNALAEIRKEGTKFFCSACRMQLPMNKVARVMQMRALEHCDTCNRILYSPDKL